MGDARMSHRIKPIVRWMTRRDLPALLSIELSGTSDPWTEADFLRSQIGLVAEYRNTIIGHVAYRLEKRAVVVLRLAVDLDFRRIGVGTEIFLRLLSKLSPGRRDRLIIPCPDSCLDAHLFCKAMGLRATMVRDGEEHFYQFVATCDPPPSSPGALVDCGGEEVSRD